MQNKTDDIYKTLERVVNDALAFSQSYYGLFDEAQEQHAFFVKLIQNILAETCDKLKLTPELRKELFDHWGVPL